MAELFEVGHTMRKVEPENGDTFTLEELQKHIDGYVEMIPVDGKFLIVDEEGRYKGSPINVNASAIYGEGLVGNVLVCSAEELD